MAMKAVIDTLEGLPDLIREQYEPKDGKFVLRVEGVLPGFTPSSELAEANSRLTEFRDNNRRLNALKTELETKLASFTGIDPAQHAALVAKIKELEDRGVKGGADVAAIAEAAVRAAVTPLQTQLSAMQESEANARAANLRLQLTQDLTAAGNKAGVNPVAMPDYIERGLKMFRIEDGRPVAKKGDAPIFSKLRPADLLTVDEWALELQTEAPHIFLPSNGGGGGGRKEGGNGGHGNQRTISSDPLEFGRNLEGIAKGDVRVQQ